MTGLVKTDESDGNISVDMVKKKMDMKARQRYR